MTTRPLLLSKTARSLPLLVLGCAFLWGCGRTDGSHVGSSALQQACSSFTDVYQQRDTHCYGVTPFSDP
jgi:hypothetical protein